MPSRSTKPRSAVDEQLRREEHARRVVAKVRANKEFMAGVRESLSARMRGERGIAFETLKQDIERARAG